ncbi:hypothetical protein M422DRAFT_782697 [Sphaerobolus stellatus SS14]|uniref:Unplaced genomic scaffold SPHSTscaffold_119, whole genome shotgun sequence n=1 Tax=Sphaerobolus stellatus (strain SS14) TaxID=990650 RepID=A0A0C9UJF1_SPHS4|nr:hypothetical protein M422DRAFT_782697 [Sphaerobolus stellatus SS14]
MHVLILGATGPAGIQLIEYTLKESNTVAVYARNPSKLPESIASNPSVTVIKGELDDREALKGGLTGVDAVLSALGPNSAFHPSAAPLAKAYVLLLELMKEANVKRIILLGTASITDPNDKSNWTFWLLINAVSILARNAYKDIVAIGKTVGAEQELSWTIVRVPILTDKDDDSFVVGYVGDNKTNASLSRKGFAAFVTQELKENNWVRKQPLISSP